MFGWTAAAPHPHPGCADRLRQPGARREELIAFEWEGQLLYAYSLYPHRILMVRPSDGACIERWTSSYAPLWALISKTSVVIHGSGTATLVRDPGQRAGVELHYVALMHTVSPEGSYTTLAYRFQPHPPFAILGVSAPLPLQHPTGAFASGLLITQTKAVVSYGASDAESRALVMDLEGFRSLFRSCNGTGV